MLTAPRMMPHPPWTTAGLPPPPKHHHPGGTFQFSHLPKGLGQATHPALTKQLNSHEAQCNSNTCSRTSAQHFTLSWSHPFPESGLHGKGISPALQTPPGMTMGHLQTGSQYSKSANTRKMYQEPPQAPAWGGIEPKLVMQTPGFKE